MRILFIALILLFLVNLVFRHSEEDYKGMSFWKFILNYTAISSRGRDLADEQTDSFLKQLKDQKEDLDYLQEQVKNLREGLKEMPDNSQNGYFRDLLSKYENKEQALNQHVMQMDNSFQQKMQTMSPQEAARVSPLLQQSQQNFQEQAQRMNDLIESNQMRAEAQAERLSDLMEQNRMNLEALIERTNNILEQRQNPLNPDKYLQAK